MTGDWEVLAGIRKGDKPNPATHLYKAYCKWCAKVGIAPTEERGFLQYLIEYRGYNLERHREKTCIMLDRWKVPKSTMYKIRRKPKARCKHCGSLYQIKTVPKPVREPT